MRKYRLYLHSDYSLKFLDEIEAESADKAVESYYDDASSWNQGDKVFVIASTNLHGPYVVQQETKTTIVRMEQVPA